MNEKILIILPFIFLLFLVPSVYAVPGTWRGFVYVNGSLASNGTQVTAHINNASAVAATASTGTPETAGTGYYIINVESSSGTNVSFKVWDIWSNLVDQAWSAGLHPNGTDPYMNLSVTTLANGIACTYNGSCTSGYCVDGYCCNSQCTGACNRCNNTGSLGTCTDVNTLCAGTTSSCYCSAGSCVACSSGYTCTNYACVAEVVVGGGGGAIVVPPTVISETETISSIAAGGSATVTIEKSAELKIQEISVTTSNAVSNVQLTVKEVTALPTAVAPVGTVNKYLNIEKVNIADADISKVKIKFKVEKSWVINNNISTATIALNRWSEDKWNKLITSLINQDASYYYFEAESPGLSYFAITGEKIKEEVPPVEECPTCPSPTAWSECVEGKQTRTNYRCSAATNYICEAYTEEQSCEIPPEEIVEEEVAPPVPTYWIGAVIIVIILIAAVWYFYKPKKIKKPKK